MGAKILLHFSKDTLTNFPLIIKGYVNTTVVKPAIGEFVTAANSLKSVETNFSPLEEVSSSAS